MVAQSTLEWNRKQTINPFRRSGSTAPFDGIISNRILTSLSGEEFARLVPCLEPVKLLSGNTLYHLGEPTKFFYFPETVVVSHVYLLEDGSTTGATIVGNEGMVGLLSLLDRRPPYAAEITVSGLALRIDNEVIKAEFAQGLALQRLLLNHISTRLAELSQLIACQRRHRLLERFCTWLLMINDRARRPQLRLTHEEIARLLGARRPGVTSFCTKLRHQGIINYRRGSIEILDRHRLEAVACECYNSLRLA